jgi:hypothetical protein
MLSDATEPHHGRMDVGKRFDARVRLMQGFTCGLLGVVVVAGCSANRPEALSWSGQWSQQSDAVGALISTSDSDVLSISAASCVKFVAVGTECTPSATQSQVLSDIGPLADDIDAIVASEIPTR